MRKLYIYPQVKSIIFDCEKLLAASETLERGEGSGGNVAEVKSQRDIDDTDDWSIWD